jgi:type I restriction-modification system DNA methylase subunit
MSRDEAREAVRTLVDRYLADRATYERVDGAYSEAQARYDFITPFLEAFGWDLANREGLPDSTREVRVEESVELADENDLGGVGAAGNPDYTIQPDGKRRFFVEAKKPSVRVRTALAPAYQTRRYGWSAGLGISVLTNFAELAIYDCRVQPRPRDDAAIARVPGHLYTCEDYVERFDDLWRALSKESVQDGTFDTEFDVERELRGEASFDSVFLDQIREWRRTLAADIAQRNRELDARAVGRAAQRLLNRLVFLRVCEDRNLEDYGNLLRINDGDALIARFHKADQVYNAGLFRALDEVDVDAELIHQLVAQLYYPESPYAFSVVEAPVLASIYEQFLAERVELHADRSVELVRKPEVVHAGGIVSTPGYIVDAILSRALIPALDSRSLDEVRRLRIADLACGSGTFLLGALRLLLARFEAEGIESSLELKHSILSNNIFGVDIDAEAVEVTRFNLLLAVIEDEDRERLARFGAAALPDIDAQVVSGNSLITPHFLEVFPDVRESRDDLLSVNPFDFATAFEGVMREGGFDVIVGNPPYVRIQTLAEFDPLQVAYFQSPDAPFQSARSFNFDKYLLFIERAVELLNPHGRFGFIVPHRFMSTLPGQAVRKLLSDGKHVNEIVHFGHEQVFPGSTTYTCLLIGTKDASPTFNVSLVDSLTAWREDGTATVRSFRADEIGVSPWTFGPEEASAIFGRLRSQHTQTLRDVADIFVGVQTSADDIYFVRPDSVTAAEITFQKDGHNWRVEREICRPALRDRTLLPYDGKPEPDAWAIFPYEIDTTERRARANVISPERMAADFPLAWAYLSAHREQLEQRSITPSTPETWYRYGRSQSLTKLDEEKIILRVLSLVPQYNWDPDGLLVPGGGDGGPYYLIRPLPDNPLSVGYLIALLSHPVIDAMVWEAGGREYRGGYFPHRKAFLADLPVPTHDPVHAERIADLTQTLIETTIRLRSENDSQMRLVLERDRIAQRTRVEAEVSSILGLSASDLKAVVGE